MHLSASLLPVSAFTVKYKARTSAWVSNDKPLLSSVWDKTACRAYAWASHLKHLFLCWYLFLWYLACVCWRILLVRRRSHFVLPSRVIAGRRHRQTRYSLKAVTLVGHVTCPVPRLLPSFRSTISSRHVVPGQVLLASSASVPFGYHPSEGRIYSAVSVLATEAAAHNKLQHALNGNEPSERATVRTVRIADLDGYYNTRYNSQKLYSVVQAVRSVSLPYLAGANVLPVQYVLGARSEHLNTRFGVAFVPTEATDVELASLAKPTVHPDSTYLAMNSRFRRHYPHGSNMDSEDVFEFPLTCNLIPHRRGNHYMAGEAIWDLETKADVPWSVQGGDAFDALRLGSFDTRTWTQIDTALGASRAYDARGARLVQGWESQMQQRLHALRNVLVQDNRGQRYFRVAYRLWTRYFTAAMMESYQMPGSNWHYTASAAQVPAPGILLASAVPAVAEAGQPPADPEAQFKAQFWNIVNGHTAFVDCEGLSQDEINELIFCFGPSELGQWDYERQGAALQTPCINQWKLSGVSNVLLHYGSTPAPARAPDHPGWNLRPNAAVIAGLLARLATRHHATQDILDAYDLAASRNVGFNTNESPAWLPASMHWYSSGMFEGQTWHCTKDFTLPAYLDVARVPDLVSSELTAITALSFRQLLWHSYYRAIALAASFNWACYAANLNGSFWHHDVQSPRIRQHRTYLLHRSRARDLCPFDRIYANACAMMYGFAPAYTTLQAVAPERTRGHNQALGTQMKPAHVPFAVSPYFEAWMLKRVPEHQVLPGPETAPSWPDDTARPIKHDSDVPEAVRLAATLAPLSTQEWVADGGMMRNAQYYASMFDGQHWRHRPEDAAWIAERPHQGRAWLVPHEYELPAAPNAFELSYMEGAFTDFLVPGSIRNYNMVRRRREAVGVATTGVWATPERNNWHRLASGKPGYALAIEYLSPSFLRREQDQPLDYDILALADPEAENGFVGFGLSSLQAIEGWAAKLSQRELVPLPVTDTPAQGPIGLPSTHANDNSLGLGARGRAGNGVYTSRSAKGNKTAETFSAAVAQKKAARTADRATISKAGGNATSYAEATASTSPLRASVVDGVLRFDPLVKGDARPDPTPSAGYVPYTRPTARPLSKPDSIRQQHSPRLHTTEPVQPDQRFSVPAPRPLPQQESYGHRGCQAMFTDSTGRQYPIVNGALAGLVPNSAITEFLESKMSPAERQSNESEKRAAFNEGVRESGLAMPSVPAAAHVRPTATTAPSTSAAQGYRPWSGGPTMSNVASLRTLAADATPSDHVAVRAQHSFVNSAKDTFLGSSLLNAGQDGAADSSLSRDSDSHFPMSAGTTAADATRSRSLFAFLEASDNPPLESRLLTKMLSTHTYKNSQPGVEFNLELPHVQALDFAGLVRANALTEPPQTPLACALAYMLVYPTPREVFSACPWLLSLYSEEVFAGLSWSPAPTLSGTRQAAALLRAQRTRVRRTPSETGCVRPVYAFMVPIGLGKTWAVQHDARTRTKGAIPGAPIIEYDSLVPRALEEARNKATSEAASPDDVDWDYWNKTIWDALADVPEGTVVLVHGPEVAAYKGWLNLGGVTTAAPDDDEAPNNTGWLPHPDQSKRVLAEHNRAALRRLPNVKTVKSFVGVERSIRRARYNANAINNAMVFLPYIRDSGVAYASCGSANVNVPGALTHALERLAPYLDALYPIAEGRPGQKTLLTAGELLKLGRGNTAVVGLAVLYLLFQGDFDNITIANLFAAALSSRSVAAFLADEAAAALADPSASHVLLGDHARFVKWCKAVHVFTRMSSATPNGRIMPLLEAHTWYGFDSLPGRGNRYKYDAASEILMRAIPGGVKAVPVVRIRGREVEAHLDTAAFVEKFETQLRRVVCSWLPDGHVVELETFRDWYAGRLSWASSGAAPGFRLTDNTVGEKARLNKRGALLHLDDRHLARILVRPGDAVLHSRAAVKYELSKNRPLWNTATEHYVASSFVLEQLDRAMSEEISWNAAYHHAGQRVYHDRLRLQRLSERTGLMWDYSDFNINHELWMMARLWQATADRMMLLAKNTSPPTAIEDLSVVADWLVAAKMNTVMDDPDSGLICQVVRSLMTGERGTSYQNTALNRIDVEIVRDVARDLFGRDLIDDSSYEVGDDVFATCANPIDGCLASALFNLCGLAGQVIKIKNDYRGVGEFLRRAYYSTSALARADDLQPDDVPGGFVGGYPLRSTLGLVSGEYFETATVDAAQRMAAIEEQLLKVVNRGSEIDPAAWREALAQKHGTVVFSPNDHTRLELRVPLELVTTPMANGGLGTTIGAEGRLLAAAGVAPPLTYLSLDRDGLPLRVRVRAFTHSCRYPKLTAPRHYLDAVIRGSRVVDLVTADRLRLNSRAREVISANITNSAILSSLPAKVKQDAMTRYGAELAEWLQSTRRADRDIELSPEVRKAMYLAVIATPSVLESLMAGHPPLHRYGEYSKRSRAFGFSSWENVLAAVTGATPARGVSGKQRAQWIALLTTTTARPWMIGDASTLARVDLDEASRLLDFWTGAFSFYPPTTTARTSDIISLCRDVALHLIERHPGLLFASADELRVVCAYLEMYANTRLHADYLQVGRLQLVD